MDSNIAHTDFDGIDPTIYKRRWLILTTLCLALLGVEVGEQGVDADAGGGAFGFAGFNDVLGS